MSKYREPSEPHEVDFYEIDTLEKLLDTKKLTEKQKSALKSLLQEHYTR